MKYKFSKIRSSLIAHRSSLIAHRCAPSLTPRKTPKLTLCRRKFSFPAVFLRPFALLSLALLLVACDPPEDSGAGSNPSGLSNPTGEKEPASADQQQAKLTELPKKLGGSSGPKTGSGDSGSNDTAGEKESPSTVPAKIDISTGTLTASAPQAFAASASDAQLAPTAISVNDAAGNPLVYGTDYTLAIAFRNDMGAFTPAQGVVTNITDVNDVLTLAITDDGKVSATPVSGNPPDAATYIYVVTATGTGNYEGTVTQEVTITVEQLAFAYETEITATAGGSSVHTSTIIGTGSFNADHYTFAIAKDDTSNLRDPLPIGVMVDPDTGQISVDEELVIVAFGGSYTVTATPGSSSPVAGEVTASVMITVSPKKDISTGTLTVPAPQAFGASASDAQLGSTAISVNDDEGNSLVYGTDYTLAIAPRTDLGVFTAAQGVKASIRDVTAVLTLAITDEGKVSATPVAGGYLVGGTYIYTVTATGTGNYEGTVTQDVTITVTQDVAIPEKPAFAYTKAITVSGRITDKSYEIDPIGTGGFNASDYTFAIVKDDTSKLRDPLPSAVSFNAATGQIIVDESFGSAGADGTYTVTATPKSGGEAVTASFTITVSQ